MHNTARREQRARASKRGAPGAPWLLLWIVGGLAIAVAAVAFALWGIAGASTILDLIDAYCGYPPRPRGLWMSA
jgi:hypothetical protein